MEKDTLEGVLIRSKEGRRLLQQFRREMGEKENS
jgi:hypothetical protein